MAFTGKSTYAAGAALPEILEDVGDIIGIVSPHETPLLDHLGDPRREARSTVHEWLEDDLLPNTDHVNQSSFSPNASDDNTIVVDNGSRFRAGDQVRAEGSKEIMLVSGVNANSLSLTRGYGGTTTEPLADNKKLFIVGNAAIEGADAPSARFTNRARKSNYTQIFTSTVEVSGSQQAVHTIGINDEMDYQKQERLRELLRDLENSVINGVAPSTTKEGSDTVRRTMRGILPSISTNVFMPGVDDIPSGDGVLTNMLNEDVLNASLRAIWENSSSSVDTILVNGFQKRRINGFVGDKRGFMPSDERFRDLVSVYESDYGVARVVLSRWVPEDTAVLLDSSRIDVLPLSGRSFQFKTLPTSGDSEAGQLIGEYTLELRNENAHGVLTNLGWS